MSPQPFTLFTTNYTRFRADMGVPVRTSNGAPRYPLKYDLEHAVKEVFPPWALVKAGPPRDVFEEKYRASLAEHGVETLASRFRAVATAAGEERLVLLCFEAIEKPNNWCHRTMFARWWGEQTGDEVRELGPAEWSPDQEDPTLFD